MKKPAPKGQTAKHSGGKKHATAGAAGVSAKHKPAKHHPVKKPVHAKPATPKTPPKARQLALAPGDVALCSAEAVAASLRRALGACVRHEDILELYWRTASDPDAGATVLATLRAAREHGLAGIRPVWFEPVTLGADGQLILGAEMPGSHALFAEPRGWWSWGELYTPDEWPEAVIEEAWIVRWPS